MAETYLTYAYAPLNEGEIRLIHLAPGTFDDDIEFVLEHVRLEQAPNTSMNQTRLNMDEIRKTVQDPWAVEETLDGRYLFWSPSEAISQWNHPDASFSSKLYAGYPVVPSCIYEYEALSYVWGDGEASCSSFVISDDIKPSHSESRLRLPIGTNLAEALRHLRYDNKWRTLWIDAICIHQQDIAEKSMQVMNMAQIYKLAHRVVVWLGPEGDNSSLALFALETLGTSIIQCKNEQSYIVVDNENPSVFTTTDSLETLPWDAKIWRATADLFNRSWFERLWVCQEIQAANYRAVVQCGPDTIGWTMLRSSVAMLSAFDHPELYEFGVYITNPYGLVLNYECSPLESTFTNLSWRLCQDPRDKIYALLGVLAESFAQAIVPTYDLPYAQVFKDATLLYIKCSNRLDMVGKVASSGNGISDSPSWMFDWSQDWSKIPLYVSVASGVSGAYAEFTAPNILVVTGSIVGRLASVRDPLNNSSAEERARQIQQWEPQNIDQGQYPTGLGKLDAFVLTLVYGVSDERFPGGTWPTVVEWINLYREYLDPVNPGRTTNAQLLTSIGQLDGQTFAISDTGLYGIVPAKAQSGDLFCTILGCASPVVLRPQQDNKFTVIGISYFHGVESGEAMFGSFPEDWSMRVIIEGGSAATIEYFNSRTIEQTPEDPRLWPLSEDWERVPAVRTKNDPYVFTRFRNVHTGEFVSTDPRLTEEQLEAHGIALQKFQLV